MTPRHGTFRPGGRNWAGKELQRGNIQLRTVNPVGFHSDPGKGGK